MFNIRCEMGTAFLNIIHINIELQSLNLGVGLRFAVYLYILIEPR